MRSKILYPIAGILLLFTFVQCENSLTTPDISEEEEEVPIPELVSPTNNATNQSIQVELNWKKIKGAKDYKIQLSETESFESTLVDSMVEGSSYTTPSLETENTYFWRVKPFKKNQEGPWSDTWQFTTSSGETEPVTVKLQSPDDGTVVKTETPIFEWSSVSESTDYHYQLSKDNNFNDLVKDSVIEITNLEITLSDSGGTYHWRVSPIVDSAATEWSEVYDFTKEETSNDSTFLTPPQQVSPSNEATGVSLQPTFEWEPVDGADYYILHANRIDPTEMVIENEVNGTSFTPSSDLDASTKHDWRVRAVSGDIKSEWSSIYSFTTKSQSNDDSGDNTNSVEGDRQALMDLYEATGGASWSNNSGWGSGNPDGSWYGVEVDGSGRVVRLDLQDNGLTGQLPESIGNLSNVQYLNVVRNNLSGEIPSSIGNLASVEWLRLSGTGGDDLDNVGHHPSKSNNSGNSFTGNMPAELGKLQNLQYLQIGGNDFSGGIPPELGNAQNLIGIYLNWGNLSDPIPAEIGNLSNLRFLHLRKNNLSGSLPPELGTLSNLQVFRVNFNELTGSIPSSFSNLTNLMWFVVDENNFEGEWPKWWNNGSFSQINTLRGEWNNFTGTLHGFDNLTNLKSFSVTGNDMSGTLPESMTAPKGIINFTFGWNGFEGEIPQSGWKEMYQMRQLRLNNNSLVGQIPDGLPDSPDLKYLYFGNNNLSGTVSTNHGKYADSGQFPEFNYMNIGGNSFSSSDYQDLLDILGNKLKY